MNKKLFYCLLFVGLFPLLVSGLETQVISISDCVNLNVELMNTTLPVDNGEYSFKDCTQNASLWSCNCNGDYKLILLTNITTLNTYDFRINYTTKYTTQSTHRGGGSGGSWKPLNITNTTNTTPIYIYTSNYTNKTNETTQINVTPSPIITPTINLTNPAPSNPVPIYQPPTPPPNNSGINPVDGSKFPTALIIIISILVIISFILIKTVNGKKPKKPKYKNVPENKVVINPKWRQ